LAAIVLRFADEAPQAHEKNAATSFERFDLTLV
jgi:hypothetical protein